jgi:hypothetical protein
MEVCEELAFHGIEYILSVSVADGQVLHVDVEKVRAPCESRNARLSAQHTALHSRGGARATRARAHERARCAEGGRRAVAWRV